MTMTVDELKKMNLDELNQLPVSQAARRILLEEQQPLDTRELYCLQLLEWWASQESQQLPIGKRHDLDGAIATLQIKPPWMTLRVLLFSSDPSVPNSSPDEEDLLDSESLTEILVNNLLINLSALD